MARTSIKLLVLWMAIAAFGRSACGQAVTYTYDELGRLIGVVAPNGESATYRYDAVGNLLSITRTGATQVSIAGFASKSGVVGTSVTISGSGFSTTAGQNTVLSTT